MMLRRFNAELPYPSNPSDYETSYPKEEFIFTRIEYCPPRMPPSLTLRSSDTQGYYAMKRPGMYFNCKSGESPDELLRDNIKYFIEREGGIVEYNGVKYISDYADRIIQTLIEPYNKYKEDNPA
jgi:hypothetical protein